MSRFYKLSHSMWHCQYHIVWTPKYRFRILQGDIAIKVEDCIKIFSERSKCKLVEFNVQKDHVHILIMVPPKLSVSSFVGIVKGRTAITIFKKFPNLRQKPYWGNHFWARGYCVDTVGLNAEQIRKYVKYQEKRERNGII